MANQPASAPWRTCMRCGFEGPSAQFAKGRNTCRDCWNTKMRAYNARYRAEHPEAVRSSLRAWRLNNRYGLSVDQYETLLQIQDDACAICAKPFEDGRACIDHDHSCCPGDTSCGACVRGILCTTCNTLLGMAYDDTAILNAAITYLGD